MHIGAVVYSTNIRVWSNVIRACVYSVVCPKQNALKSIENVLLTKVIRAGGAIVLVVFFR